MRPSTTAATRLILLTLALGVFALGWAGDGPGTSVPSIACRTYPLASSHSMAHRDNVLRGAHPPDPRLATQSVSLNVELPSFIAAGEYRVVDEVGNVSRVSISEGSPPNATQRDFYVHDGDDGIRRYFIRISPRGKDIADSDASRKCPVSVRR